MADGLTEEIIVNLGRIARLDVRSRNEVEALRGGVQSTRAIGRRLGVAYVVTGSVRPVLHGVRVSAELASAIRGRVVWARTFERADADLASLTTAIADSIARGIVGRLLPDEERTLARTRTRSAAAYDLYLRGVAAARGFDAMGLRRADGLFAEAVRADSNFADAWAARADVWGWLADTWEAPGVAYPLAREYARRAIALDPGQPLALAADAAVRLFYDWDVAGAVSASDRAIRASPGDVVPRLVRAVAFAVSQDTAAAIAEIRRADALDSLDSRVALVTVTVLFLYLGQDSAAFAAMHRLENGPLRDFALGQQMWMLSILRRCDEASALKRRLGATALPMYPCLPAGAAGVAMADSMVSSWQTGGGYLMPTEPAFLYGWVGDVDRAVPWLERGLASRSWFVRWLAFDHRAGPLLGDPRVQDIIRRAEAATVRSP